MKKLYIVVPCYNEQDILPSTAKTLLQKLTSLIEASQTSPDSKIVFVDDGSKDKTWDIIKALCTQSRLFGAVKLSRNTGHQNALYAGLMEIKDECDAAISIDADLQDDINVIDQMLAEFENGCDVVYGVRNSRDSDTFVKKTTAEGFYHLMKLLGTETVFNHADCRLLSSRAINALSQYREVNLYLRGMVPLIGYKSTCVTYDRSKRSAGETKYSLRKMLALAGNGITSFSCAPLRAIMFCGFILLAIAVLWALGMLIYRLCGNTNSPAALIICAVLGIGSINLTALGIVGEYVGKALAEAKQRPRYIVEERLK